MAYFPMFIELTGRRCLVAGGGQVALRKVEVLKDFGAHVIVTAPAILLQIKKIEGIDCFEKCFEKEDLDGIELAVAATDDPQLNHQISQACLEAKIPVNAVDQIDDCSFIFPSYIRQGDVVAAFSSGGRSPVVTQYLKSQMQDVVTPHLAGLSACLGALRRHVQQCTRSEAARKQIYREILELGLSQERIPSDIEIKQIIEKFH